MVDLSVKLVGNIVLKNPIVIASGIPGTNALKMFVEKGVGAVTTKTVTPEPRRGHPPPNIIRLSYGFINAIGLRNPGIEGFIPELRELVEVARSHNSIVIGSVGAGTVEGYVNVSSRLEENGVDMVELNVSCPTAKDVYSVGMDLKYLVEIVRETKSVLKIPVAVKLTPSYVDMGKVARLVVDAGADVLVAINTVAPATSLDINTGRPLLGNPEGFGGLSGPAIKPIAIAKVMEIALEVDVPVIGTGGIMDWRDAVEMILAGASAVGVLSAYFTRGFSFIDDILNGLSRYMVEKDYKSIEDFRGKALEYIKKE